TPTRVERIFGYRHLTEADLSPPPGPHVFFDPVDTEVGVWATVDLIGEGSTVLDLGSGSGAAAAAVARAGARRIHGLDISRESVKWASENYSRDTGGARVTFGVGDFSKLSTSELIEIFGAPAPAVVTSNPPYVPVVPPAGQRKVSVDGGPDGLRWVRVIVRQAAGLGSDLALTIGSYSSPRIAARLLAESGYGIRSVTLGALPLGDFTLSHMDQVLRLEEEGEAPLLRGEDGVIRYVIVGLSCRRVEEKAGDAPDLGFAPDDLLSLLNLACRSRTGALEALDAAPATWPFPVRIVVLPDSPVRRHS
ncbi:MAG: methyltransferase domain-containing protein, partial [Actinomycetota bacterium]